MKTVRINLLEHQLIVHFETPLPIRYSVSSAILDATGKVKIWEVIDSFDEDGSYLPICQQICHRSVLEAYLNESRTERQKLYRQQEQLSMFSFQAKARAEGRTSVLTSAHLMADNLLRALESERLRLEGPAIPQRVLPLPQATARSRTFCVSPPPSYSQATARN